VTKFKVESICVSGNLSWLRVANLFSVITFFFETAVHFYDVKVGLIYEASSTDEEAIPSSETLKFTQQSEPYL